MGAEFALGLAEEKIKVLEKALQLSEEDLETERAAYRIAMGLYEYRLKLSLELAAELEDHMEYVAICTQMSQEINDATSKALKILKEE